MARRSLSRGRSPKRGSGRECVPGVSPFDVVTRSPAPRLPIFFYTQVRYDNLGSHPRWVASLSYTGLSATTGSADFGLAAAIVGPPADPAKPENHKTAQGAGANRRRRDKREAQARRLNFATWIQCRAHWKADKANRSSASTTCQGSHGDTSR